MCKALGFLVVSDRVLVCECWRAGLSASLSVFWQSGRERSLSLPTENFRLRQEWQDSDLAAPRL